MAKDENQTQRESVPKEPSIGSNPVYGACTRWMQRIKRQRLLHCIIMSKVKSNKQGRCSASKLQLHQQEEKSRSYWYWVLLLFCVAMGLCGERYTNSMTNYCDRSHRLGDMVTHVRRHVLNQEEALDQLEWALDNATFQAIALVGPTGVGIGRTARTLRKHFPWPENVKMLSWKESPTLLRVQTMLSNIVQCGQNLILIDDMKPLDGYLVPILNELIRGRKDIANGSSYQPHLKHLTSIFLFSLDRQQPKEIFQTQLEALKQLPGTHVIIYDAVEPSDLVDSNNVDSVEELPKDINEKKASIGAQKLVTEEEAYSGFTFIKSYFNFHY